MPVVATAGGLPTRLGKYEIMMPLAAGGMARIYIGRTTGIGSFERHVVLKLITPERANDVTAVQMFLDEARLAASLNHQNVAQVFEVGEDAGIHYLAMEYVHGQDLRALLAKAGSQGTRVPLELALTVVAGAASGLNHAHDRRGPDGVPLGIVHRDVSPSNIMIGYDGSVKLLDFGIAKATARSIETQSGIIKGKFAYMAPEQCRGRDVDKRSDVFSLGIILYEVTTQHRCFRAESDFDTMHRIVTGDVVRPTRLVQGYPQALEAIVMKALAVDVSQRYQSAAALLEALEAFAVSARMSLSTMSLGRFMRDMFGDLSEPWLNQSGRFQQPVQPKESTVSNTNGTGSASMHAHPLGATTLPTTPPPAPELPPPEAGPDAAVLAGLQGATILDLPGGLTGAHTELEGDPSHAEWNPKSYPQQPTGFASGAPSTEPLRSSAPAIAPPLAPPQPSPPHPLASPPQGSQPLPPVHPSQVPAPGQVPPGQFSTGVGSGSGPAHQPIPSTRHGYASAPGAPGTPSMSPYPLYEPPAEAVDDLRLQPNRRPLLIGIGVAVLGVIVILAVALGGGKKDDATKARGVGSDDQEAPAPGSANAAVPVRPVPVPVVDAGSGAGSASGSATTAKTPTPAVVKTPETSEPVAPPEDASISIHVVSDPAGADVLLAGKPIGTTPLETKLKRGTGLAILTVHKARFVDVSTKIDLSGEVFSKDVTLKRVEDPPTSPPIAVAPKSDTVTVRVTSTPPGAEVMLGGKTLGITPIELKVKRGGSTSLVVRRAKYQDLTTKVDLSSDVKRDLTLKKVPDHTMDAPKKPACQPPGQVDPFDPRPPCRT